MKERKKRISQTIIIGVMTFMLLISNIGINTTVASELSEHSVEDGIYSIEASIQQLYSDALSMADSALKGATIEVSNDSATLFLDMGELMGMYLSGLKYHDDISNQEIPLTVTKVEEGNNVQYSMPITIAVTDIVLEFSVAAMPSAQKARLTLDWSSLSLTTTKPTPTVSPSPTATVSPTVSPTPTTSPSPMVSPSVTATPTLTATPTVTVIPSPIVTPSVIVSPSVAPTETTTPTDIQTILDKNNLADGIYEVQVDLWHAINDQASMASAAVVKIARIEVESGKYKMRLYTKSMEVGNIMASLQLLQVEDGKSGYVQAEITSKSAQGDPTSFSFELPHKNEYLAVKVDPKVAIMGNNYIDARLKINWDALKQVSSYTKIDEAPNDEDANKDNSGSSGSTGGTSSSSNKKDTGSSTGSSKSSPKTGDNNNIYILVGMMILSMLVIGFVIKKRPGRNLNVNNK